MSRLTKAAPPASSAPLASITGAGQPGTGSSASFIDVPVGLVRPNPGQPRKFFDPEALAELAASIKASGLLEVPAVRPDPENPGGYLLIAGERRWRACQLAGMDVMPVRVMHGLGDVDAFVLSVAENVNRADMTVLEEAKAYATLSNVGKTVEEIADLFGKRAQDIGWRIELLRLREDLQELVDKGVIKATLAWYMSDLSVAGQQVLAARYLQGAFRTDSDAIALAREMKNAEGVMPMFEVQEWTPTEKPEAKPRPTPVGMAVATVDQLVEQLQRVADADPDALLDVDDLADALDRLKLATNAARKAVRTAQARALVAEAAGDL